ncbi:hypothetical protein TNCV_573441 [Trichonephila clavipes]|nr:hypothetical protein TNCV_573441 [Trichonephila clavipes]
MVPWIVCLSINVGTVTTHLKTFKPFKWLLQSLLDVPFFTRILFETYKSERFFEHFSFVMDMIDAFPEHISTTVVPVTLPINQMRWNMLLEIQIDCSKIPTKGWFTFTATYFLPKKTLPLACKR